MPDQFRRTPHPGRATQILRWTYAAIGECLDAVCVVPIQMRHGLANHSQQTIRKFESRRKRVMCGTKSKKSITKTYRSCGTIRAAIRFGAESSNDKIQFTPDQNHSIKRKNKCHAIFVELSEKNEEKPLSLEEKPLSLLAFPLEEDECGSHSVSLECSTPLENSPAVAVAIAGIKHTRVGIEIKQRIEIEIEQNAPLSDCKSDCKVIAITIPTNSGDCKVIAITIPAK